jgi:dihydrofolate reductase
VYTKDLVASKPFEKSQDGPRIAIVAAMGKNRELGLNGELLWHIPDDLKRFKALTMGHPVLMGRKTFDSIMTMLGTPLPGRTNIVLTRDPRWRQDRVLVVNSLEDGLTKARVLDDTEIHIGGGAELYKQVFPQVDRLYLTLIDDTKKADTFFPPYEKLFPRVVSEEVREYNGLKYRWLTLER